MIGYNISEANQLMEQIAQCYEKMGEKMSEGWPALKATLQQNWVGTDEVAYSKELADVICKTYQDVSGSVQIAIDNMKATAENWKEFQKNNTFEGAEKKDNGITINDVKIKTFDIGSAVKVEDIAFNENTTFGLTNGMQSASNIKSFLDSYCADVTNSIKEMYRNLDSSRAFLGELSNKINEYLSSMGESIANIEKTRKLITDYIDELITKNYSNITTNMGNSISNATSEINK